MTGGEKAKELLSKVIETEPKRDEYYSKLALCAGMKYYSCGEETEDIIKTIQREIDD